MKVAYWGTYDPERSRNRILVRGLRSNGVEVMECNADAWRGVRDKSRALNWRRGLLLLARLAVRYPYLLIQYLQLPRHEFVLVGYLGHFDVLMIWPLARLRQARIVWNAYISLYDTIIDDRKLVSSRSPFAKVLWTWEWLCCRAADIIMLDTKAHAEYFARQYRARRDRVISVWVGVEPEVFPPQVSGGVSDATDEPISLLYYGQMIPLHGLDTILKAAELTSGSNVKWTLIGHGQDESKVAQAVAGGTAENIEWIRWVPKGELIVKIHAADICLGIFGDSRKAERVIPNKVFEVLSAGKPLITRDSPAIRELLDPNTRGVYLVPPGDPEALLQAIRKFQADRRTLVMNDLHNGVRDQIQPTALGAQLLKALAPL